MRKVAVLKVRFVASAVAALPLIACAAPHPAAESPAGPPVEVRAVRADMADLPSSLEAGGVVRARLMTSIASRVLAPIAEVRVRPGDRVRRGEALVVLDGRELAANRTRAAASLAAAEQGTTAADAARRGAEAAVTLAQSTHDRIAALHARKSATPQELDEAVAALAGARSRAAAATAQVAEARASLDAARAASEGANVSASYATLLAPFDGVVTERFADPGTMATPGAPLLTVEDTSSFRLEAKLDENRAAGVSIGDAADVRVDREGEGWVHARVAEIARVDPSSHSFVVKLDLPSSPALRSGLYGVVRLAGPTRQGIALPASSLVTRGQLTFVYAVDSNSVARLRPVSASAPIGDRAEILAGVRPGDQVVVAPPLSLTDGARVRTGAGR